MIRAWFSGLGCWFDSAKTRRVVCPAPRTSPVPTTTATSEGGDRDVRASGRRLRRAGALHRSLRLERHRGHVDAGSRATSASTMLGPPLIRRPCAEAVISVDLDAPTLGAARTAAPPAQPEILAQGRVGAALAAPTRPVPRRARATSRCSVGSATSPSLRAALRRPPRPRCSRSGRTLALLVAPARLRCRVRCALEGQSAAPRAWRGRPPAPAMRRRPAVALRRRVPSYRRRRAPVDRTHARLGPAGAPCGCVVAGAKPGSLLLSGG